MRPGLLPVALLVLLSAMATSGAVVSKDTAADSLDADPEQTFTIPLRQEMPAKSAWPELVGLPGEEAKSRLEAELPAGSLVLLVPEHSMMTMDFRTNRVRIIVSRDTGLVVSPPRIG